MTDLAGHLLTPGGWLRGHLRLHDGCIDSIDGDAVSEAQARADVQRPLLLPGFVDLHLHGGGGADVMDAGGAVETVGRLHAQHGTTSWLATTMTAPMGEIEAALHALAPHVEQRPDGSARVLGVHLEGPYLSPHRLGAQPAFTRLPALAEILALHAIAPIRVITLAPEVEGAIALIPALVAAGLRVQLGHSEADHACGTAALAAGACGFTHLFNAMGPFHHREPGLVGAALALGEAAELIPDLLHLHPLVLRAALRALPRCHAVTDATAAAGMPDGEYLLGRQRVRLCAGAVRMADGTLAGSALTMDQALRNLVAIGLAIEQASACCSRHAADHIGETRRGRLAVGAWADVVALDPATLALRGVWIEGEPV